MTGWRSEEKGAQPSSGTHLLPMTSDIG